MEFVHGPGLWPDPALGLPEKGLKTPYRGFAAMVADTNSLIPFFTMAVLIDGRKGRKILA